MNKEYSILYTKLYMGGKHQETMEQFKEQKTDQERIVFILKLMQKYDILFPIGTGMPKNACESDKLRVQCNQIFARGMPDNISCINALKLYTKCIAFAPYPSRQLALGYGNRSAVLFQLNLYSECIQDIDRALAINYPDYLRAKLYLRKTKCLMILKNSSMKDSLEEAQHWLEKMSLDDTSRGKLKTKLDVLRIKTLETELHATETEDTETKDTETKILESPLPTIQSYNNEVPFASDAIAIKYNKCYGRHLVATRDIRPGEVIAVEKPYALMLVKENIQTHCSNCLRVCWANIPCNYCTYVMYCSEECKNVDWKKCHDIECTVLPALIEYEMYNLDLFSLRLAVLALKEAVGITELRTMLKEVDEHNDLRTKGFSRDRKFYNNRYISVYSCVTHTEERSVPDLFKRSLDSSFILYLLATRSVIFGDKLPEDLSVLAKNNDVTFIGGLILKHQQIISVNMHNFGEVKGTEYVNRGIAAMPFFSIINHSCNPNVLSYSRPEHMVICAISPIQKGEQIFDNYGIHFGNMRKATRRLYLNIQYYFACDCTACKEDWPLYNKLQSYKTLVKNPEDKAKIEEALKKFNTYDNLATQDKVRDNPYVIEDLLKIVQVLHDYAPIPCEELSNVVEALKRIYNLHGNVNEMPLIWKDEKLTRYIS